jgi:hypothetical protein
VKIRLLALSLVSVAGVYGQGKSPRSLHGHEPHSWQEDCFKNQGLPYCQGRDFAIKPTSEGKDAPRNGYKDPGELPVVSGGIDWRFADPEADSLAGFNFRKLSASPLARSLMTQLGANQGLTADDMRRIFAALSGVNEVALSVHENQIVVMITGRATDSTLPTLEAGWRAALVAGDGMLMGNAEAVDQVAQRIATQGSLAELTRRAQWLQADSDFWAVGSSKLLDAQTASAGMKRFSLMVSTRDRFASDTAFEFDGAPDADKLRTWLASLGGATIEGSAVHVRVSMEPDEAPQWFPQIGVSPLGQRLGTLVKAARYLPARDATSTGRTKPGIYGLDSGPKEVNQ